MRTCALIAITAVLAACGGSSTPPLTSSYASLSASQKSQVDSVILDRINTSMGSMLNFHAELVPLGFQRIAEHQATNGLRMSGSRVRAPFAASQVTCGESDTPSTPADQDHDNVPDTVTRVYTCTRTDTSGTYTEAGTVGEGDPTSLAMDMDYAAGGHLMQTLSSHGETDTVTVTASTLMTQTSTVMNAASSSNTYVSIHGSTTASNNGSVTLTEGDTVSYTASSTLPAMEGQVFPPGTYNMSGTWSLRAQEPTINANLSFQVSTPGGLQIDGSTCIQNPSYIKSGTVVVKFSDGAKVTATWSGCPQSPQIQ